MGEDLYASPQYWLQKMGYVPADNVLHEHLGLREALVYVGRLRLPEMPIAQVEGRVDALLEQFHFRHSDERLTKPLRVLSSGERKRANICAELITDPPILLLDEPTSNLDPDAEQKIMHLLADYAHGDQRTTVLVITHTLNTIDACDEVMFVENAHLLAAGPAQEVMGTLEAQVRGPALGTSDFYRWARIFQQYPTNPDSRKLRSEMHVVAVSPDATRRVYPATASPWLYQLRCLVGRYLRVRLGDRWSLIGTLLAGMSGILFFTLPGKAFTKPVDESEVALALNLARQSVYVVALVVAMIGLITSYTEISKEYRIYRHERLKGLSPSTYFAVEVYLVDAGSRCAGPHPAVGIHRARVQAAAGRFSRAPNRRSGGMVGGLVRFQLAGLVGARSSWLILSVLVFACTTSVTLGLFISALAGDSDKGYLYLSFVVVFIVLFSGLIRNEKLQHLVDSLSFLSTGRWAFEGFASSISLYCWLDSWRFEEFNSTGHLLSIYLALGALSLGSAFTAVIVLRLRDPWSDQWTNLRQLITCEWRPALVCLAALAVLVSYTVFLRQQSYQYHALNYWSRQEYGGNNAYQYANISRVQDPSPLQYWNGMISQSWCGR